MGAESDICKCGYHRAAHDAYGWTPACSDFRSRTTAPDINKVIPDEIGRLVAWLDEYAREGMHPNLRALATAIRSLLAERERNGWKPIESAPKDGTFILAFCVGGEIPAIIHWTGNLWEDCDESRGHFLPRHWQPLPSPPARSAIQEG